MRYLPSAATVIVLFIVWEAAVDICHVSERVISSPSTIWKATILNWKSLSTALYVTSYEALIGFAFSIVIGIALGVGLYSSRLLHATVYPLLTGAQTLPLITIAPLFIIWFGFDVSGKIALIIVFSIFPIAVQTCRGLMAVPQYFADVALTCGATRIWTLWHVQLRVAARQIFGGIRIAATYVFATAATAEYMGARYGLGIWLQAAYNSFRTPLIFSATFAIIIATAILLGIVSFVENLLLGPASEDSID